MRPSLRTSHFYAVLGNHIVISHLSYFVAIRLFIPIVNFFFFFRIYGNTKISKFIYPFFHSFLFTVYFTRRRIRTQLLTVPSTELYTDPSFWDIDVVSMTRIKRANSSTTSSVVFSILRCTCTMLWWSRHNYVCKDCISSQRTMIMTVVRILYLFYVNTFIIMIWLQISNSNSNVFFIIRNARLSLINIQVYTKSIKIVHACIVETNHPWGGAMVTIIVTRCGWKWKNNRLRVGEFGGIELKREKSVKSFKFVIKWKITSYEFVICW